MALTQTGMDISNAVNLRLQELGYALPASHKAALAADIMAVINADAVNVVAHAAIDVVSSQAPPHKKF